MGILLLQNVAEILLDLSYLLLPSLVIVLLVRLFNMSTTERKLQDDNFNLELTHLKSQINPHFLFNILNSLYSFALHNSDKTADVILKLSDLMRYMVYESNTTKILMSEELTFLKNYIGLERILDVGKVKITFDIEGDYENLSIAPLIIFPFVENAFKHGVGGSPGNSWIIIKLKFHDKRLNVFISNSRGLRRGNSKRVGGIGITNAKKRLELLYPNSHGLNMIKTGTTFTIEMSISLG